MPRIGLLRSYRRLPAPLLASVILLLPTACRQAPPPPRGVDENPPVEEIAEETVESAPENARVLLQTDWVTATEVRLTPGERITLHRDGERVAYAHTAHTLRFTPLSGALSSSTLRFRAGEAARHPSGALTVENTGDTEARFVVVNRSSQPLPPQAGDGPGLGGAAGARELFRDPALAVHALTVEPGGSVSAANGPLEAVHVLGPGALRVTGDDPQTAAQTLGPGQALTVAGRSKVENPGGQPARTIVFTFER